MNILVIDVGGTHARCSPPGKRAPGDSFWPGVHTKEDGRWSSGELTRDWSYDVVAMGYPGPVLHNRPVAEPHNLGTRLGRIQFLIGIQASRPNRQRRSNASAGGYRRGRCLSGFRHRIGIAPIVDGIVEPMELGHLPYKKGTFEDYVGLRGLEDLAKRNGGATWPMSCND